MADASVIGMILCRYCNVYVHKSAYYQNHRNGYCLKCMSHHKTKNVLKKSRSIASSYNQVDSSGDNKNMMDFNDGKNNYFNSNAENHAIEDCEDNPFPSVSATYLTRKHHQNINFFRTPPPQNSNPNSSSPTHSLPQNVWCSGKRLDEVNCHVEMACHEDKLHIYRAIRFLGIQVVAVGWMMSFKGICCMVHHTF